MIFQWTYEQVLAGLKTQTRRLAEPDDRAAYDDNGKIISVGRAGRLKWEVYESAGRTYAVQPGRNKKSVGRIRITEIRQEPLQEISEEDARAEGVASIRAYARLWDEIHSKPGTRWEDGPLVWVISFELVEDSND